MMERIRRASVGTSTSILKTSATSRWESEPDEEAIDCLFRCSPRTYHCRSCAEGKAIVRLASEDHEAEMDRLVCSPPVTSHHQSYAGAREISRSENVSDLECKRVIDLVAEEANEIRFCQD